MSRVRILFVDDEPSILRSFKVLFWADRARWEVVLVPGSKEALAEIALAPFDVVVSDMRMPGMNGIELLERVKLESPSTVRIMLSGSADRDDHVRALAVVHELLGKPCEAKAIRGSVERLLHRRNVQSGDAA